MRDFWGDEFSVFFWNRVNEVNINTVLGVISKINPSIIWHQSPDPHHVVIPLSNNYCNEKIKITKWFNEKTDLYAEILKCGIYMAPRVTEGIGMSFLEAMAMGRCVISPNGGTMNEYIVHGETGILYDLNDIRPLSKTMLSKENIRKLQNNAFNFVKNGYNNWIEKNQL